MKRLVLSLICVLFTASPVFAYEETRELSLSADGIDRLEAECGSGFLKLSGEEGLETVEVTGDIEIDGVGDIAAEAFLKSNLWFSLERKGGAAILTAKFEPKGKSLTSLISSLFSGLPKSRIDLTVRVPKTFDVRIRDGSGDIQIRELSGDLEIRDGSADILVTALDGDCRIIDGSGNITVQEITGSLFVEDGAGDVLVATVRGDVEVRDGSGNLHIDGAGGTVTVKDGSGDIAVKHVGGDIRIKDGSGDLTIEDVEGEVKVADGGGFLDIDGAMRDVVVTEKSNGNVDIRNVSGRVSKP